MRYIKALIIGLLALYVLLTVIGLIMPSSVTAGRSISIYAPIDTIRFYTNDPSHWRFWINGADTSFYKQLTNTTKDNGSKIMLGTYTITLLKHDGDTLYSVWQGQSTKEQMNKLDLYHNPSNDSTTVNWAFQQHLSAFPWDRLGALLYDQVYGPSMEASLNKLKAVCEKNN